MSSFLELHRDHLKASKRAREKARRVPLPVIDPPAVPDDELLTLIRREAGNRPWIWIPVTPMGAVRQVKKDDWRPSEKVRRYRAWRDRIRPHLNQVQIPEAGAHWLFLFQIPESWWDAKKRRAAWAGHCSAPDTDNCLKAVLDAALKGDAHIWDARATKRWWWHGGIVLILPEQERA